ncbi:hypothetical protein CLU96_2113 [Chryseobacterium sp. 52]|uniref:hypothetical protein n=1 Tax=Chryseobacterium sp. 52 TaxID=2035213 RepID=UPI000C175838|nr:hypothetical protein [Chryseobacterium sp. 52]PIF45113.1 hypothetical protein CLU96_2113 [Chryseobacterium sp. 52]
MKKLILLACLIVAFTLFYYPVFDSTGISYLIIFSCFVIICFAGAKLYSLNEKDDYEAVEREMDILNDFDGIFQYTNDGFYINRGNSVELVKWDGIISVNSFSIPVVYRGRAAGLEITTDTKSYEFNDQDTPGIEKLTNKLYENLQVGKEELKRIRVNNHGLEKINLFKRNDKSC